MGKGLIIEIRRNKNKLKGINKSLKSKGCNKIKLRKKYIFPLLLFYLFIIINLNILIISKNIEKYKIVKLYSLNEITIKIRGGEKQKILNSNYKYVPTEVLANGKSLIIESGNTISNLQEKENIIIMKWNYTIKDCEDIFYTLTNLLEVDLSNFDASELTSMMFMFLGCSNLTSINLNNLNTPKLNNL
jgi:surface protein